MPEKGEHRERMRAREAYSGGLVERELRFDFDEFRSLPRHRVIADIHCVTKWSKFDTEWEGVEVRRLLELAGVGPTATHAESRTAPSRDGPARCPAESAPAAT